MVRAAISRTRSRRARLDWRRKDLESLLGLLRAGLRKRGSSVRKFRFVLSIVFTVLTLFVCRRVPRNHHLATRVGGGLEMLLLSIVVAVEADVCDRVRRTWRSHR